MARRVLPLLAALALLAPAELHADPAIGARVDAVLADDAVTITEAGKTVLVYRTKPLDPANEPGRLNYVHPLYAPDGTVLTEDKPADHLHQRGAFWSWHQVLVNGKAVADGWFMKGLTFHVRGRRFKGDAQGGGNIDGQRRLDRQFRPGARLCGARDHAGQGVSAEGRRPAHHVRHPDHLAHRRPGPGRQR
jgi:hypothetical protein